MHITTELIRENTIKRRNSYSSKEWSFSLGGGSLVQFTKMLTNPYSKEWRDYKRLSMKEQIDWIVDYINRRGKPFYINVTEATLEGIATQSVGWEDVHPVTFWEDQIFYDYGLSPNSYYLPLGIKTIPKYDNWLKEVLREWRQECGIMRATFPSSRLLDLIQQNANQ